MNLGVPRIKKSRAKTVLDVMVVFYLVITIFFTAYMDTGGIKFNNKWATCSLKDSNDVPIVGSDCQSIC